jgi:amidase
VIRPAAYCGIVGFKPTFGRYSLAGVQPLSPSADTLGLFGRHVDDVRFFDVCLSGRPASPQATTALPQRIAVPLPWMSTFMTAPAMTHLAAFAEHMRASGVEVVTDCDLEPITRVARNYCLFRSEISRFLPAWLKSRTVEVDPTTQRLIDCGFGVTADELAAAVADLLGAVSCCRGLLETVSLIVTAAATGEAPLFGIANDSNLLNRAWTMLHLPVVAVPFGTGSTGLPLGLQVIGRHGEDAAVLDAAEAIESIGRSRSAANHL